MRPRFWRRKREVRVVLDAADPPALLDPQFTPTPEGVWLRLSGRSQMWGEVEIRGPRAAVRDYVADHWGEETAEQVLPCRA